MEQSYFLEKLSPAGRNSFLQLNETRIYNPFLGGGRLGSLEGYFWSQVYDSMHYQTALKTQMSSSQESCYCLANQSLVIVSVASSVGCASPQRVLVPGMHADFQTSE